MYTLIIIGAGLSVGIVRCMMFKKGKKSKKLRYYNYSKFAVKYNKINKNISEQTKGIF